MICADLHWRTGILVCVRLQGHATAAQRELCAAVSCLLRSSAEALQQAAEGGQASLDWQLQIPCEGEFAWRLRRWPQALAPYLCGVSQVLAGGLRRLATDFPQQLCLCEQSDEPPRGGV